MAPKKIFLNGLDTYVGSRVGEFLAKQAVGGTSAEEDDEDEEEGAAPKECYEIVGTAAAGYSKAKWVADVIDGTSEDAVKEAVLAADYVVWDISSDAEQVQAGYNAINALAENTDGNVGSKVFVCLSSVLTWGKTRPQDMEDPTAPVLEEEFKRRRAHNKYRRHIDLEKHVTQCGKVTPSKLQTFVVASGINYGAGENVLHGMFRSAWHLSPEKLQVFGKGENAVPMIHVLDLASVVINVLEQLPEAKYLLAVDSATSTVGEIAQCIAENLGTGACESTDGKLPELEITVPISIDEILSLDLRLESGAVKDLGNVQWKAPEGIIESIADVIQEYKVARNLLPLKVYVHGPPLSDTEALARDLCATYKLHYVSKESVIADKLASLKTSASRLLSGEELEDEASAQATEDKGTLDELETMLAENKGAYEEETVIAWYKAKLNSMACKNQGYVSDNYPATTDQAGPLFEPGEDSEADPDLPDPVTVPEFVFGLDATDDLLFKRAIELPEAEAQDKGFTEEGTKATVAAFRKANTEETTVLNYFDYLEIHPVVVDIEGRSNLDILKLMKTTIGEPHNYGPSDEEKVELAAAAAAKKAEDDAAAAAAKEVADAAEAATRTKHQSEWDTKVGEIKKQEAEVLEASALPLRTFLMRHVMPTLASGLADVCKTRPADPVDALAEFLFKANPQIE